MSEQYRFLRYYIPGFLFLTYFFGLVTVNIDRSIFELFRVLRLDPTSLVAVAFTSSPAIGYLIYQFYDWSLYNRIAKSKERKALILIDKWATEEKFPKGERWEVKRKELVDFALYSSLEESDFTISDKISETIRGFWSHVNARLVSSIFVPIASGVFFAICWILNIILVLNLPFKFDLPKTVVLIILVIILSAFITYPAKRTIREAFALEEFVIRVRKQVIRNYMKLETESKASSKI